MPQLGTFTLPTITEADWIKFLQKHPFPSPYSSSVFLQQAPVAEPEPEPEDDDGLGYYPDGVKRTITDEQIAIFRHSEIQALLKQRREQEWEAAEQADIVDSTEPADAAPTATRHHKRKKSLSPSVSPVRRNTSSIEGSPAPVQSKASSADPPPAPSTSSEDEASPPWAYRGNSDNARHRKKKTKKKTTKTNRRSKGEVTRNSEEHVRKSREGEYTHRRVARALDEVKEVSINLEY